MWMTSNSRDNNAHLWNRKTIPWPGPSKILLAVALLQCFSLLGCSQQQEAQAPDSPRPAKEATVRQIPREDDSAYKGTIELAGVHFRRMDKTMVQMAGPQFMKQAREPFAMEVETANPLPKTPRNTSAILIVNGEKILDTWMVLPNKLIAFFPDSRKIRESNSVAAAWTGAEATSQTRKPLTFRRQDVKIE